MLNCNVETTNRITLFTHLDTFVVYFLLTLPYFLLLAISVLSTGVAKLAPKRQKHEALVVGLMRWWWLSLWPGCASALVSQSVTECENSVLVSV